MRAGSLRPAAPPASVRRFLSPIETFIAAESSGGMVLIAAALIAFIWANSPYAHGYHELQHMPVGVNLGLVEITTSFAHFVNDALMAVFFFMVGMEIKREMVAGELAGWRRAAMPFIAAAGGMIAPALIYLALTVGTGLTHGWGVPMATDIAFAVGVLALLGSRVPFPLKIFLLALAIVDDLGAVLVIAVFYTSDLNLWALAASLGLWLLAVLYGLTGGGRPLVYGLLGVPMWSAMLFSGVHATIAGVLLAFAVPMVHGVGPAELRRELADCLGGTNFEQIEVRLQELENVVERAQSPLHNFERYLQPWVVYLIMPLFALANAGVTIGGSGGGEPVLSAATYGAFAGLLLGKPIGIMAAVGLVVALKIAPLPKGVNWLAMTGMSVLAGIGFTMAIFIANLAYPDIANLDQAKLGVLGASVVAAIIGYAFLHIALASPSPATAPAPGE